MSTIETPLTTDIQRSGRYRSRSWRTVLAVILSILIICLFWPYRSEHVEGAAIQNVTRCQIAVQNYSGWIDRPIAPGINSSSVAYPLKVVVFVDHCERSSGAVPYAASLVSANAGRVAALGAACGSASEKGYPCRLEMPPITSLSKPDYLIVKVVLKQNDKPRDAKIRLFVKREWRSVLIDAILSA